MTNDLLPDRWHSRDFPVLLAAARYLDSDQLPPASAADLASETGLDAHDVIRACQALYPGFIAGRPIESMGGVDDFFVTALTERGRRAVGLWPDGEDAVQQLLDALRQAEELTDDPDDKSALRKAGGQLASVSRGVVAEVIAAVIARQSGLG